MHFAAALIRGFVSGAAARNTSIARRSRGFIYPANYCISVLSTRRTMACESQSESEDDVPDGEIPLRPWLMLSSVYHPGIEFLLDPVIQVIPHSFRLPSLAGHHLLGSSQGYIISIDKTTKSDIHAVNPRTDNSLRIPSTAALPKLTTYDPIFTGESLLAWNYRSIEKGKAILSPSLDTIIVMPLGRPMYARIGDSSWTLLRNMPTTSPLQDGTFHKGRLFAVNYNGDLLIYDLEDPTKQPVCHNTPFRGDATYHTYLVESPDGNDLFLVCRKWRSHVAHWMNISLAKCPAVGWCRVFKFNEHNFMWTDVEGIGDLAMFIGLNHSLALPVCDFYNLEANCIYYTRSPVILTPFDREDLIDITNFAGVFNLGDQKLMPYSGLPFEYDYPQPIWFMPSAC